MDRNWNKGNEEQQKDSMLSDNNHREKREGKLKEVKEEKDAGESYMDYNGNSEANAPARARE